MKRPRTVAILAAAVLSSFLFLPVAGAHDAGRHGPSAAPRVEPPGPAVPKRLDESEQRNYFTDTPLLTQEGRKVHFYSDVLKGKVVLISFIYTNCTDICPLLMHNLQDVQDKLGDRFGRDIFFVSISVDPEDDTPEELRKYGERYNAKAGWTFLTGTKENVDRVVYRLGQYAPDFEDHSMLFLLGDVKNARWQKIRGDLPPDSVTPRILDLLRRRDGL